MTDEVTEAALDDNMPTDEATEVSEVNEEVTEVTATSDTEVSSEDSQVIEIDEKQKALNKLAFEKREETRQRKALEEELARIKAQTPQVAVQVEAAPKLEDFDYDQDAYNDALIDYKVNLKAQQIVSQQDERMALERQNKVKADFNARAEKLKAKAPDFDEALNMIPILPTETLNTIMQADNGADLAYYLGKHLDVADAIASLSPTMAAMKLGQISAQLATAKPINKQSAAPDPIEPVTSSSSLSKSQDDMSMEEIMAL